MLSPQKRNPVWSGCITWVIILFTHLAKIVVNIRRSQFNKEMGLYDWQSVGSLPSLCMTIIVASFQEGARVPDSRQQWYACANRREIISLNSLINPSGPGILLYLSTEITSSISLIGLSNSFSLYQLTLLVLFFEGRISILHHQCMSRNSCIRFYKNVWKETRYLI